MWDNFFEKFGSVVSKYYMQLLSGLKTTLIIAFSAFAIGVVLGTIIAIVKVTPKYRNWFLKILEKIFDVYVTVVRGTPVVVQLLLMYFGLLAGSMLTSTESGTMFVAIIVFGLNSAAYQSEFIRGALLSVDKGQLEAGRALGLSYSTSMLRIVIPQAVKSVIPTMGNELITLLKDTSVAGYIAVIDITFAVQRIVARNYMALVDYMILAVVYLVIVLIVTLVLKFIEKQLRKSDSRNVMTRKKVSDKNFAAANAVSVSGEMTENKANDGGEKNE